MLNIQINIQDKEDSDDEETFDAGKSVLASGKRIKLMTMEICVKA